MSWDEVAYALNSRVKGDASNMKSLDVLIDEIKALNTQMQTTLNTVNSLANTINTNVNAVKTETAKNNTASATGTLSQKMSQVNNTVNTINSLATKLDRTPFSKKLFEITNPAGNVNGAFMGSLNNIVLYGLGFGIESKFANAYFGRITSNYQNDINKALKIYGKDSHGQNYGSTFLLPFVYSYKNEGTFSSPFQIILTENNRNIFHYDLISDSESTFYNEFFKYGTPAFFSDISFYGGHNNGSSSNYSYIDFYVVYKQL